MEFYGVSGSRTKTKWRQRGFFISVLSRQQMIPQKKVFHEKSNFLGTSRTIKLLGRMAKLYRFWQSFFKNSMIATFTLEMPETFF